MKPILLNSLKSNYKFEDNAHKYLEEMYKKYGGYLINDFLGEYENTYTLNDLIEVEESIRKVVICISKNDELFQVDDIFPNANEIMDIEKIYNEMERQDFLVFLTFFDDSPTNSQGYYQSGTYEYIVVEGSKFHKLPEFYKLKKYCESLRKKWLESLSKT